MTKRALVTGVTGQDGYYLSKLLLEKGYEVYGLMKDGDMPPFEQIKALYGDMHASKDLIKAVDVCEPHEIYNLAAVSDIGSSIRNPEETMLVNYEAVMTLLRRGFEKSPEMRFCQASSREIFRNDAPAPQDENSPIGFSNPYGEAKLKAYEGIKEFRREKHAFVASAIFFNHESPKRGEKFVTKKITSMLTKIKLGKVECLELGNLSAKRDWGFAGDYVEAMWLMLQQDMPDDFVIATGVTHTVRDFVQAAAESLEMKLYWEGEGEQELARDESGRIIVRVNPEFYRPLEPIDNVGDITKARSKLGWEPKVAFNDLVRLMAEADLAQESSIQ